jgi:streptogramin lyase
MLDNFLHRRIFTMVLVGLVCMLGITISARADLSVSEANLNPDSAAYEINPDPSRILWISDFTAGQIWGVNPTSGEYDIYNVTGYPGDARQAGGYLWWADGLSNMIGRVSTNDHTFTKWEIPGANAFYGTNLDDLGRMYTVDSVDPILYRLDPDGAKICSFELPGLGASTYLVRNAGYLWLGDGISSLLMRFQITDGSLTSWSLPEDSSPFGMVVDGEGNLWYIDTGLDLLGRLNPATNQLDSFALPNGDTPEMIAVQSSFLWYTEQSLPGIGRLDPIVASHTSLPLTSNNSQLTPTCTDISPSSTGTLDVTSGSFNWADTTYPIDLTAGGWKIFKMPVDSLPWGITTPGTGYVVDFGRQKLVRFSTSIPTSLVVIKHVINDNGGIAVASDFTMNIVAVNPNQTSFPGAESPGTEVFVDPGAYSVTETVPSGYSVTYSADCSGTIMASQTKTCIITNDDISSSSNVYLPLIKK